MTLYVANWEAPVVFHTFGTNLIKLGFNVKTSKVKNLPHGNVMELHAVRANQMIFIGVGIETKFIGIGASLIGDKKVRSYNGFTNLAQASIFFEEQLKCMEEWK